MSKSTHEYLPLHEVDLDEVIGWMHRENDQIPDTYQRHWDESRKSAIDESLMKLSKKEAQILRMRFGLLGPEKTLEEIGGAFEITRERIRQIEVQALRRLKTPMSATKLHKLTNEKPLNQK